MDNQIENDIITLDEYINYLQDKVIRFKKYWKDKQINVETSKWYPNELLSGEWNEQFDAFE